MSMIEETPRIQPKRDFRAKRSEAVNKHTLCGSELELHSQLEKEKIARIDLKAVQEQTEIDREAYRRRRRCAQELPDYLRSELSGDNYSAVQRQNAVSAYFTSKFILPFGSAEQYYIVVFQVHTHIHVTASAYFYFFNVLFSLDQDCFVMIYEKLLVRILNCSSIFSH